MRKQRIQIVILSVVLLICCAGFLAARFYANAEEEKEKEKEEGIYTALSFEKTDLRQLSIVGEKGELELTYDGSSWSFVNDIDAEEAALSGDESTTETSADASTAAEEASTEETSADTTEDEKAESTEENTAASEDETESADEETSEDTEDSEETSEVTYEVNSSVANEILERLASLTSSNEVDHVTDMESYGLDASVLTVTITLQDETQHTVEVGSRNEMISAYYIRVDDGDTVYTLSDSDYSLLNKTDTDVAQEAAG